MRWIRKIHYLTVQCARSILSNNLTHQWNNEDHYLHELEVLLNMKSCMDQYQVTNIITVENYWCVTCGQFGPAVKPQTKMLFSLTFFILPQSKTKCCHQNSSSIARTNSGRKRLNIECAVENQHFFLHNTKSHTRTYITQFVSLLVAKFIDFSTYNFAIGSKIIKANARHHVKSYNSHIHTLQYRIQYEQWKCFAHCVVEKMCVDDRVEWWEGLKEVIATIGRTIF